MENLEIILSLIVTSVGLLATTVAFAVKVAKYIKQKIADEGWQALLSVATELCTIAEEMVGLSGEEKLAYVLESASEWASTNDIDYDEEAVGEYVGELIDLTKLIN